MATILLVCTGNICRSPMAEGLLRQFLAERGVDEIVVESAGVSGWEGSTATADAVRAVRELGIDIARHEARRLSQSQVESADLVVALAAEHRDAVVRVHPPAEPKTFTLKELVHLLRRLHPPGDSRPAGKLQAAVAMAQQLRSEGTERPVGEDVADPLGLGLDSYRATAWELEALCRQFVDLVFGEVTAGRRA